MSSKISTRPRHISPVIAFLRCGPVDRERHDAVGAFDDAIRSTGHRVPVAVRSHELPSDTAGPRDDPDGGSTSGTCSRTKPRRRTAAPAATTRSGRAKATRSSSRATRRTTGATGTPAAGTGVTTADAVKHAGAAPTVRTRLRSRRRPARGRSGCTAATSKRSIVGAGSVRGEPLRGEPADAAPACAASPPRPASRTRRCGGSSPRRTRASRRAARSRRSRRSRTRQLRSTTA